MPEDGRDWRAIVRGDDLSMNYSFASYTDLRLWVQQTVGLWQETATEDAEGRDEAKRRLLSAAPRPPRLIPTISDLTSAYARRRLEDRLDPYIIDNMSRAPVLGYTYC